jgi:Mg2+ and Co2+ transporter CorA
VTCILAGIAAVAGVFGMSEAITALGSGYGFWLVTGLLGAAALVAVLYFRRIGWL